MSLTQFLIASLLCLVLIEPLINSIDSAPAFRANEADETHRPALPINRVIIRRQSAGDYVDSEEDFERVLERLKAEAEGSIVHNPANYVADNLDLDEILKRIAEPETTTTTGSITTQRTSNEYSTTTTASTTTATEHQPDECPICLNELSGDRKAVMKCRQCRNSMHTDCLRKWIGYNRAKGCPICRIPISGRCLY